MEIIIFLYVALPIRISSFEIKVTRTRSCSGTFKAKKAQKWLVGGGNTEHVFNNNHGGRNALNKVTTIAVPVSSKVAKECNCSHVNAHVLCDFYNWRLRQ